MIDAETHTWMMGPALPDETWTPAPEPTALYRFWDDTGDLLYIGITGRINHRLTEHSRKAWSWTATKVTLEWYPSVAEALAAETAAIQAEDPHYNINGKAS
jgi:predicted GIY-YIG superfamily endonuclease